MPRSPREVLLNTATVLREQSEVIRNCGDSQDLAESLEAVQRAIDELKGSPVVA